MALPWLRILDTAIGVADIARTAAMGRSSSVEPPPQRDEQIEAGGRGGTGLEARLAGVVVAALREAFDRDTRRLDLEREQLAAERERAERALRLEVRRQAADREIGRLRVLGGVAVAVWIATLALSTRLVGAGIGARVSIGSGWLFLLGAIAASFIGQSRAAAAAETMAGDDDSGRAFRPGASGAVALWLTILGFLLVGVAALIA